jgi:polysaccharide pyruvyl transferase CsaB
MSGYFGFDNSGDDAILKAIVNDLLDYDNDLKIKVLSNNPDKTEKMCEVFSANRFKIREVISSIKETDLLISGGGSLLQDITSTRSLLYYLALMKLALMFKKPIFVYANGIGPINKKMNRMLTRKILNKVDYISLRDNLSKEYLEELGVKNNNIKVTADPVFTLKATDENLVKDILKNEKIPIDKPIVGISIRRWNDDQKVLTEFKKTINYLVNTKQVNVILIPMHFKEDIEISNRLLELTNLEGCFILRNEYPVENILSIIKKMDLIISMRLHTLIYAASQVTPMIGIVYDPKVEGFLKEIEYDYYVDLKDIKSENLIDYIEGIYANKQAIVNKLSEKREDLMKLSKENVELVYSLLGR